MTLTLEALFAQIAISIIALVPVLWISGRLLVGVEKAKFADALWIGVVGALIGTFFGALSQQQNCSARSVCYLGDFGEALFR